MYLYVIQTKYIIYTIYIIYIYIYICVCVCEDDRMFFFLISAVMCILIVHMWKLNFRGVFGTQSNI